MTRLVLLGIPKVACTLPTLPKHHPHILGVLHLIHLRSLIKGSILLLVGQSPHSLISIPIIPILPLHILLRTQHPQNRLRVVILPSHILNRLAIHPLALSMLVVTTPRHHHRRLSIFLVKIAQFFLDFVLSSNQPIQFGTQRSM